MKMRLHLPRSLLLFSLLALSFTSAVGQADLKEKVRKEEERKQEIQRQSYLLVDEITIGALSLKLPENRSHVLADAAYLLWEKDEQRARNLFRDSFNTLTMVTVPNQNKDDKNQNRDLLLATTSLRNELLLKIARRDEQLALELLRSLPPTPADPPGQRYGVFDIEQEIANEAAVRDPKRALKLARESLAKKLTPQILNLLFRLHQLDQELSLKLAGEIIDKLQTRNFATDINASWIASELLVSSRIRNAAPVLQARSGGRLELSSEQRRQLVDMIATAALGLSGNATLLHVISNVMPEIEEFAPERVALLKRKVEAFNQTLNKEQKGWQKYNSLIGNATPEEILAGAETADSNHRRMLQQQAVVLAVMRKRADSLRNYIANEVKDDGTRRELIDALDTEQINAALRQGDADALRTVVLGVRVKEERARAMTAMAVLLEKKGDHEEALRLLDEARALVKSDFSSDTQTNALLALVGAYALVEPAKAFVLIEATIDRANDQIAKLLLLDKVVSTGVVKSGEIFLRKSGIMGDVVMLKYGKALAALANADFARTRAVADRLSRNELRLFAKLMLAQTLLLPAQRADGVEKN